MKQVATLALILLAGMAAGCATDRDTTDEAATRSGVSSQDRNFVTKAAQSNQAEIALASLASQKSRSPAVQQYADRMITDHRNANAQLLEKAQDEGIVAPQAIAPEHAKMRDQLADLSGREFDREYLSSQVSMHQEAVNLFRLQAQNGQSAELRSFARETLPVLEGHLTMAQQLAARAGVSMAE